jgi:hypothetical protein
LVFEAARIQLDEQISFLDACSFRHKSQDRHTAAFSAAFALDLARDYFLVQRLDCPGCVDTNGQRPTFDLERGNVRGLVIAAGPFHCCCRRRGNDQHRGRQYRLEHALLLAHSIASGSYSCQSPVSSTFSICVSY